MPVLPLCTPGSRPEVARYFLGCMHEQYHPRELLEQAVAGEQAGFDGIACSDHLQPWWEPGHSGQAWIWLGAAAQATARVPGESLNESPFGLDWPPRDFQLAALEEACGLIRRLWDGERVDHDGRFFKTRRVYLHTRPEKPPPLYISAFHPGAAKVAGRYGDGLWTMADPESAPKLIEVYREAAEQAGRGPGTIVLEAGFSWAPNDDEALEAARVWKGAVPEEFYTDDWFDPQAMYARGEEEVSDDDFKDRFIVSADPDEHVERIKQLEQVAYGDVVVKLSNQSGPNALEAIRIYGERVLPALRG